MPTRKERKTEYKREWRKNNREKEQKYRHAPAEKLRKRQWRAENTDKACRAASLWKKSNRAACNSIEAKRRALKKVAVPNLTAEDHKAISAMYAEAYRRTVETGIVHHVDHDKPLARGGLHHPSNLSVVPAAVNLAKGARYDSTRDFILSRQ